MDLLKEFFAATPVSQPRELHHVKLINAVSAAPVEVDGEMVAKLCVTISDGETQRDIYIFRDAVVGLPTFIPKGGLNASVTFQKSKDINPKTGNPYVNAVAIGVGA
jgi:hypothetical protein